MGLTRRGNAEAAPLPLLKRAPANRALCVLYRLSHAHENQGAALAAMVVERGNGSAGAPVRGRFG